MLLSVLAVLLGVVLVVAGVVVLLGWPFAAIVTGACLVAAGLLLDEDVFRR